MATMVSLRNELIRINFENNRIEYSHNDGRTWVTRCSTSSQGLFRCLLEFYGDLYAITSKGIYCSKNGGSTWSSRCTSSMYGEFEDLMNGGDAILARTSKGLYASKNECRTWSRRN